MAVDSKVSHADIVAFAEDRVCSTILFQNRRMIYGYARVSTEAQDLTSQLAQLKGAGCEEVFREKISLKPSSMIDGSG